MNAFFEYKWKYIISRFLSCFYNSYKGKPLVTFVLHYVSKDWIFGAKARRLSKNMKTPTKVYYIKNYNKLPDSSSFFFLHQKYFAKALRYNPFLFKRPCVVLFTHPEWTKAYSKEHIEYVLKFAAKIICLNRKMAIELENWGLNAKNIEVFHLASDDEFFHSKPLRKSHTVGFCSYYSDRKNPELLFNIVKHMPDIKFILIGRNWKNYLRFKEMKVMNNFEYFDSPEYSDYPALYHKMDVFVSTSFIEGGPVPLLEAMLCNIVPVCSNTGFCSDLIQDGVNGYLFDVNAGYEQVVPLIRKAFEIKIDIRPYALSHTWKIYGGKLDKLFNEV